MRNSVQVSYEIKRMANAPTSLHTACAGTDPGPEQKAHVNICVNDDARTHCSSFQNLLQDLLRQDPGTALPGLLLD